jgi:hypothetical protein
MPNVQALPEIPPAVAVERKQVLDRALRHLPDEVLEAMRRGLDRHDGRLRPGKLFSAEGGCAVGVMLRELFPGYQADRGLIGRLRPPKESIVDEHPQLAQSFPRLVHIEIWFDATIQVCRERDPSRSVADWAQAVGRWCAGCLYVELERRGMARQSAVRSTTTRTSPSTTPVPDNSATTRSSGGANSARLTASSTSR